MKNINPDALTPEQLADLRAEQFKLDQANRNRPKGKRPKFSPRPVVRLTEWELF